MPNMMYGSVAASTQVFMALHALFSIVTVIGLILFLIWAYKFLKEARLRHLVVLFLSVGLAGLFLTAALAGMVGVKGGNYKMMKYRMYEDYAPNAMFEISAPVTRSMPL